MLSAVVALASLLSAAPALPTPGVLVQATAESRGAAFSIGVGQCARPKGAPKDAPQECSVVVALKRGGAGAGKLEWSAPAGTITKDNVNSFVVAAPDDDSRTLTTRWSPVTVGNVNLKAGIDGLVVTQEERRNDRVRRRYDVFLARNGKLAHAFTGQEGRGSRTWSSLEPVDIDHDGGNELIFISSTTPNDEAADKLEVQVYGWRADVGKLVARNDLHPALKGGVIGVFKTIGAARALQDGPCSSGFLVLDNTTADMLGDGQVLLAWPAVLKADAELALETVKTCNPNLVGAVNELTGGVDIDAERDSE